MNLVLVTSVINARDSFFSSEERLKQTIELTIPSIRKKIPNSYVAILEGSNVSDEQKNKLEKVCDEIFYVDLGGSDKQSGEINLLYKYLTSEIFSEKENKIENLLKISGRYYFSDQFDFEKYDKSVILNSKSSWTNHTLSHTTYYKLFKDDISQFIEKLFIILKNGFFIDIEHTFYKYDMVPCEHEINKLMVSGFISRDGSIYKGY